MTSRSPLRRARATIALIAPLVLACSGSGGEPSDLTDPGSRPWAFRSSLIDTALILQITPLGSLSPPNRPLPTDHLYFRFANTNESPAARRTAFFAPADGIVTDVYTNSNPLIPDVGLRIRVTTAIHYTLGHVIPDIPLVRGTRVTAGQRLGTTGSSFDVDLGLFNDDITLGGFVNPARAGFQVHTDAPLRYFEEPLRSRLYAKVQRIGPDLDGKIDHDVPGRLSGNWFTTDSIPLVFAYDSYDPARVVVAVSGALLRNGLFSIAAADPAPRDVSIASGMVRYTLAGYPGQPGPVPRIVPSGVPTARMLVQMLDDQRIRVEMFSVSASADAFTSSAREFVR